MWPNLLMPIARPCQETSGGMVFFDALRSKNAPMVWKGLLNCEGFTFHMLSNVLDDKNYININSICNMPVASSGFGSNLLPTDFSQAWGVSLYGK